MSPLSLTIVIPAYNEGDNVDVTVGRALGVCAAEGVALDLVLVDDGSVDDTLARCQRLAAAAPDRVRVIPHPRNLGLSAALRTGYDAARGAHVTWLPADGQVDADQLPILLGPIRAGRADVVISTIPARPDSLARILISRTFRLVLRLGLGFGERLEGTYVFPKALYDRMAIVSTRGAGSIAFEIAAKARRLGARVSSVEVVCQPRRAGASKVGQHLLRNTIESLAEVWRIRRSMRR